MALLKLKQIFEGLQLRNSVKELLKILKNPVNNGLDNTTNNNGANLIGTQIDIITSLFDYQALSDINKSKCVDVKYYQILDEVEQEIEVIPATLSDAEKKSKYSVHYKLNYTVSELLNNLQDNITTLNATIIPVETIDEFIIGDTAQNVFITSALPNNSKVSMYINGILYSETEQANIDNDASYVNFWVERQADLNQATIHWQDRSMPNITSQITDKIIIKYLVDAPIHN